MNDENILESDNSLQCLRIELNSHVSVFLYYKTYPKADSLKFPQNLSAIFFYFDKEYVNDNFIYTYISLAGQIDNVEYGSYVNRKGSKKKRRVVNFAIVKFLEEEGLDTLMDRYKMQNLINELIENKRNRSIGMTYDPLKGDDEDFEEEEEDEDGFIEVRKDITKKRFSKKDISFKISKDNQEVQTKKKTKKNEEGDFYWNYQLTDKKRKMYEELKNLFEQDKQALQNKTNKKARVEI